MDLTKLKQSSQTKRKSHLKDLQESVDFKKKKKKRQRRKNMFVRKKSDGCNQ